MYSPLFYIPQILWKRKPVQLTFFVTKKCNARCPFCFYLQKKEKSLGSQPEITLQEIEKLAPSLGRILWLAFSGGEVYLREDIVDISRIFYKYNKPTILLYSTNGLMPKLIKDKTGEVLKHCPNSVVVVKLSLDGIYGEHNALRGVPKSFEKVMETYCELGELLGKYPNFELGINTVFCADNQHRVDKIIEFVKGLDHIRTHTLSVVRGELKNEDLKHIDLNKYQETIKSMEKDLKKRVTGTYRFTGARFKSAQDILQRRLIYKTLSEGRRVIPCYAGRLNLVLTEIGDVYPCELLDQKIGNVRDFNFEMRQMLLSTRAREIARQIRENRCHCSHECYFMTNILFNPRMYPRLLKEYVQL